MKIPRLASTLAIALGACTAVAPVPTPPPASAANGAREALIQFIADAEAGRFDACYGALSGELRARYTPARLSEDFKAASAVARERLARAKTAANSAPIGDADHAAFPLGNGQAVHLQRESGVWHVASLE